MIKENLTPEQEKALLDNPLKEGVLQTNCGVPMIFVINKSDVTTSEQKKIFDEKSEFILCHIREVAIEYGATIIYTSAKSNCNLKVLYQYICHTIFNFQLANKPNLIDKEAYFIPAGSDDNTELENEPVYKEFLMKTYEKEIENPTQKKNIVAENDVTCEDTNSFLREIKDKFMSKEDKSLRATLQPNAFKKNTNIDDMKNFMTNANIGIGLNLREKKNSIAVTNSFTRREKELKGKESNEERKKNIREEMLKKIGMNKTKITGKK